ncbi:cell division cycle-associated 7-like protein [Orycteropus afer afer]|uniref:Cell division cycle-associated 7-like protein n=1 Tax=Orycteropus afer afer TaxID=1230840 RepID=A0A8B7A9X2_ORYAF|nr:cell division cycle-associated 7-like protein [Orycteropus afer afer]
MQPLSCAACERKFTIGEVACLVGASRPRGAVLSGRRGALPLSRAPSAPLPRPAGAPRGARWLRGRGAFSVRLARGEPRSGGRELGGGWSPVGKNGVGDSLPGEGPAVRRGAEAPKACLPFAPWPASPPRAGNVALGCNAVDRALSVPQTSESARLAGRRGGGAPRVGTLGTPVACLRLAPRAQLGRRLDTPAASGVRVQDSVTGPNPAIPKEVADIFNAPSDDEDFVGFRDDVPMETLSSEESCDSFDSLESGRKQDVRFHSKYFTEELRRIFVEDTDSEMEDFEGFSQSDLNINNDPGEITESHLSDDSKASLVSEEEEDDEEEKATPRRSRPRRSSIGLRVAFQFPSKKLANQSDKKNSSSEPSRSSLQDNNKTVLGRQESCRQRKQREDSVSESEDDSRDEGQEGSDALLKRTMNIKENKAMLAQLLAELNSMPDFFPVRTPNSASKRTMRRAFSEGQIPRRMNPTRSARPPEKFALENFTVSAAKFAEEFYSYRRRKTISGGKCQGYRRHRSVSSFRPVEDITEEDLENVAITVRDKIYDKVLGNTCHQCRQKTIDTKTVCRNRACGGVRGQFCGPCLRNRYGEDVRSALLDPDWMCPPCRGICNCSYCRRRDGRCATGILIHLAKFYGYSNVKEYLESGGGGSALLASRSIPSLQDSQRI